MIPCAGLHRISVGILALASPEAPLQRQTQLAYKLDLTVSQSLTESVPKNLGRGLIAARKRGRVRPSAFRSTRQ